MTSVVDKIRHYQRNIERYGDNEDKILHYVSKLYKLPLTIQDLHVTEVGKTVNGLKRYNGSVSDAARALIAKWKTVIVAEQNRSSENSSKTFVPGISMNYSDTFVSLNLKDLGENFLPVGMQKSKHTRRHKDKKTEDCSLRLLSKTKTDDKHKKYENIKSDSSIDYAQSDKKLRDSKYTECASSKNVIYKLKEQKTDLVKLNTKTIETNKDDNTKKRKLEHSSLSNEVRKMRKVSDNRSAYDSERSSKSFASKSKTQTDNLSVTSDKNGLNITQLKTISRKKSESEESNCKVKYSDDKHKHKKEEDFNHKKTNTRNSCNHYANKDTSRSVDHSSSSGRDKDKRKEHKEDKNKRETTKEAKTWIANKLNSTQGIDSNSGASFADALGMCNLTKSSKKRRNESPIRIANKFMKLEQTPSPISQASSPPSALNKGQQAIIDLVSTLPEINPNYKPLPHNNSITRKEEPVKPFNGTIQIKNQRTKVYSGNKVGYTKVPTMYDLCIRVLIENMDALEYTGGVPYDILKPVLERATVDQLYRLEHHNAYLIESTGDLWEFHCNREFRNERRQEMESWREMYMRCLDEREVKLKTLTANIKQSINNSTPLRSAKLAYVDHVAKPPRNVLKKQEKYGTANNTQSSVSSLKQRLIGGGINNPTNIAIPSSSMRPPKSAAKKKTTAPLMAKTLQFIKARYNVKR